MHSMYKFEVALKQVLNEYRHLDMTTYILVHASTQMGGGGFSDVFRSEIDEVKLRYLSHNPCVQMFLNSQGMDHSAAKRSVVVAVKRLRFWGRPISKVEKVIAL